MTCPSPEYCAMNGCSANGCARYTAPTWAAVPARPAAPWRDLAFGVVCLAAPFVCVAIVLAALWVML